MSAWTCQRDCFVYSRYHTEGRVYEFSDDVIISPKNFKLVAKVYKCDECGKVVSTALALSGHSRSHKKEVTNGNTTS
ncbi:MAG: C2H2-type zinc finger protein [Nanoarchaeota archaeon]|nr:C2H2-type zinc finger protein [Nanoarchaeota archaeon]